MEETIAISQGQLTEGEEENILCQIEYDTNFENNNYLLD
jgi:hypothetical protein